MISFLLNSCDSEKKLQKLKKPNILFIMADDLGWKDVGCMGSKYYETPNIDRLASQGKIFTDAYTCAPNCAPTRACLVSGQYSPRHGLYTVRTAVRGVDSLRKLVPVENRKFVNNKPVLDTSVVTIAETLKRNGYVTAHIGKWHLGGPPYYCPESQGFDINIGGGHGGHTGQWESPKPYFSPYNNPTLEDGPEGEYLTDRLTEEAVSFIENNQDNPFFLYLPYYSPHSPHRAKEQEIEKFKKKEPWNGHNEPVYAAMIHSVDRGVGRLMKILEQLNLKKETMVIFYSDNGGVGGYREDSINWWSITSQKPLRGGKGMFYEGGIRVPLVICWPGKIKPGSICNTPVISVDFYPTFLEIAGIAKNKRKILDGESLLPLLTDRGSFSREAIYWHFPCYLEGREGTFRTCPVGVIRSDNFKLMEFFEDNRLELYNLKDDPNEQNNLALDKRYQEKLNEMKAELKWHLMKVPGTFAEFKG